MQNFWGTYYVTYLESTIEIWRPERSKVQGNNKPECYLNQPMKENSRYLILLLAYLLECNPVTDKSRKRLQVAKK
jgi:hypothetical protein